MFHTKVAIEVLSRFHTKVVSHKGRHRGFMFHTKVGIEVLCFTQR